MPIYVSKRMREVGPTNTNNYKIIDLYHLKTFQGKTHLKRINNDDAEYFGSSVLIAFMYKR